MSGPPPPLPMPTQHAAAPPRAVGVRWTVLALLFAATTLCYLDRTVLAVLGPTLTEALHWSEGDYSHVVMAFQLAYAIGLAAAGRFLDVIGVRLGYALAVGAWRRPDRMRRSWSSCAGLRPGPVGWRPSAPGRSWRPRPGSSTGAG